MTMSSNFTYNRTYGRGRGRGRGYQDKASPSKSSESSQGNEPLFKCKSCLTRLPTKVVNGVIMKRWDDEICGNCFAANDISQNLDKYGITPNLVQFINNLTQKEAILVGHYINDEPNIGTLISDLLTGLRIMRTGIDYDGGDLDGPNEEDDLNQLKRCLIDIKAVKPKLMSLLYQKMVSD